MKNLIVLIATLFTFSLIGQTEGPTSSIDPILGMTKKEFILQKLQLAGDQAEIFSVFYDSYLNKRSTLMEQKFTYINDVSESSTNINSNMSRVSTVLELFHSRELSLLQRAQSQLGNMLGHRTADQFAIVEYYLMNLENAVEMEQIPILQPGTLSGATAPEPEPTKDEIKAQKKAAKEQKKAEKQMEGDETPRPEEK